jgi:hypothetical protein
MVWPKCNEPDYVPHPLRLACRTWVPREPETYDSRQPDIEFPSSVHDNQDFGAGNKTPRLGHSQLQQVEQPGPDMPLDSSQAHSNQTEKVATDGVLAERPKITPQSDHTSEVQESLARLSEHANEGK